MSKLCQIRLERLPKRDAVARLRAAYASLERGWQARRATDRQPQATSKQEEVSWNAPPFTPVSQHLSKKNKEPSPVK